MKILLALPIVLFCFSINTYAAEYQFVAVDNKSTTKVCMAAVTDNTEVMKSKLRMLSRRGTALTFRSFVNTIHCNEQFIANFALSYNAENTFEYLNKYTNKWNKKRQSKVTIKDIAYKHALDTADVIVVQVSSN